MKRLVKRYNDIFWSGIVFISAKIFILPIYYSSVHFIEENSAYVGTTRFGNFDGFHYLAIAKAGYGDFQQAFFPLYPLLIRFLQQLFGTSYEVAGLLISNVSFFLFLYFFIKLVKGVVSKKSSYWGLLFLAAFPTAFFFQGIYTESLFFFLVVLTFYLFYKKKYFLAFLIAGIASGTRVVGIFLFPSLILAIVFIKNYRWNFKFALNLIIYSLLGSSGLVLYMWYLGNTYSDPLLFIHSQSAFGANRSDGEIILLPQVIFRYLKIFLTVHPSTLTFWVSFAEIVSVILGAAACVYGIRKKVPMQLVIFSILALIFPTLSGTFSSMPRYILVLPVVPIFFFMIFKHKTIKIFVLLGSLLFQTILALIFFSGFFVS